MSAPAAISIDVDSIGCYHAIHGLPVPKLDPIFRVALPRFLESMAQRNLRATLFVVGQDLLDPEHARLIGDAARAGHEIASHSDAHDYGLSRRSRAEMDADLFRANTAIEAATGRAPRGFRAPGYNQSEALLDAVQAAGMVYDSSYFPTPAYFAARAAAIGMYRLRKRFTHSLVGNVREFAAPRVPFHPAIGARHRPARDTETARDLVEVPMAVASSLRLPWLGTTLALAHDEIGRRLTRSALSFRRGPVVLELHAIDFLGDQDGVSDELQAAQPDLHVPLETKLKRLENAFSQIQDAREVVPIEDIAAAA